MPSEGPKPRNPDRSSSHGDGGEGTGPENEYDGYRADRDERTVADEPDVLLDVPVLKVEEIDLESDELETRVSLRAELADLVRINVGVDASLNKVKLGAKGVEAQALLKVRLDRVLDTFDRALGSIDRNPQIVGGIVREAGRVADVTDEAVESEGGATSRGGEGRDTSDPNAAGSNVAGEVG